MKKLILLFAFTLSFFASFGQSVVEYLPCLNVVHVDTLASCNDSNYVVVDNNQISQFLTGHNGVYNIISTNDSTNNFNVTIVNPYTDTNTSLTIDGSSNGFYVSTANFDGTLGTSIFMDPQNGVIYINNSSVNGEFVINNTNGIIMQSPDRSCWQYIPANGTGILTPVSVTCP